MYTYFVSYNFKKTEYRMFSADSVSTGFGHAVIERDKLILSGDDIQSIADVLAKDNNFDTVVVLNLQELKSNS